MMTETNRNAFRGRVLASSGLTPYARRGALSFKAQQWALEQDDVKGLDKWILFILAYRDNPDEPHGCFPSINRMALDCGMNRRTVIRIIQRLEEAGKIKSETRRKVNGDRSSNYYSFPQVWKPLVVAESHQVVAVRHQGSGIRGKKVVAVRHPNNKDLTEREHSRSALSLPAEEERKLQQQFLTTMKSIARGKAL
jgi:hypothetical protein